MIIHFLEKKINLRNLCSWFLKKNTETVKILLFILSVIFLTASPPMVMFKHISAVCALLSQLTVHILDTRLTK